MTTRLWRTACASATGTSHVKTNSPCQDAGGVALSGEILIAAVSDGAGTASRSESGSALTVTRFLEDFGAAATRGIDSIDEDFARNWIASLRENIAVLALDEGCKPADYACTILGAVVGPSSSAYLQIGDGAIVVGPDEDGEYHWIFWPQHGEYANSTFFVTQDHAHEVLLFENGPAVDHIALFSDGIERLVLDLSARTVHSPSLKPIFEWLTQTSPDDKIRSSQAIMAYLNSDHVNRRTDDDKTLVIATRPATSTD